MSTPSAARSGLCLLAVTGSGIFAGTLLTIRLTLGGYWLALPADQFQASFATLAPHIMKAIPWGLMSGLIGLAGLVWLDRHDREMAMIWAASLLCVAIVLVITAVWFVPTNALIEAGKVSLDQVAALRASWLAHHEWRLGFAVLGTAIAAWGAILPPQGHAD